MLDIATIARAEESRQARGASEVADGFRAIGGGVMLWGRVGGWMNYATGMGLAGPVPEDELDAMEATYVERGVEPRVELCPLAEASLLVSLERRGFALRGFEDVLYREIVPDEQFRPLIGAPPELRIQTVDPRDHAMVREFAMTAVSGFLPVGQAVPQQSLVVSERVVRHPRVVAIIAKLPGEDARMLAVGAGSMEVAPCEVPGVGMITSLFGLTVREPFRRRGVQQAMIAWRLNEARARGARLATIGSKPGAGTARNVMRMGFRVAYTRAIVAKRGVGPDGTPLIAQPM
jgi:GNAT superfamily N-acetyltransferase